jgi:hypothetical protein
MTTTDESPSVIIEPDLLPRASSMPRFPPKPPGLQRYFRCADVDEDGHEDCHYLLVANDLEHAKQLLRLAGVEFNDPSVPFDHARLAWKEIRDERAAEIYCDNTDIDGTRRPLNTFEPGDWFSSAW